MARKTKNTSGGSNAQAPAPTQILQGIEVPTSSIQPAQFFRLTRRMTFKQQTSKQYSGLGQTDNVQILQAGIVSALVIKFSGTLTTAGTVSTTCRWPYDLVRAARFSANGQSNLINCGGWALKARELMSVPGLNDRGVTQQVGANQVSQGTMSLAREKWAAPMGGAITKPLVNAPVELTWIVPVAQDTVTLTGAIFAQTSATDLLLAIDWAQPSDLFQGLSTDNTATLNGTFSVTGTMFSIPQAPNGQIIIPDLSVFHSLIQSRQQNIANGTNEVRLTGQGVGKQLCRVFWRTINNSNAAASIMPVDDTTLGQVGWRFGGNDTPEVWSSGGEMAYNTERTAGSDLSSVHGVKLFDFVNENAFRDTVDEGTASELRYFQEVQASVNLNSAVDEYVQETLSIGSVS
jgi:hypothetical protein